MNAIASSSRKFAGSFFSPKQAAFLAARSTPWAFAMWVAMLALAAAFLATYYAGVDYGWLRENTMGQAIAGQQASTGVESSLDRFLQPAVMIPLSMAGSWFQHLLALVALAGYVRLYSLIAGAETTLSSCLAFAAIALAGAAFDQVASLIALFVEGGARVQIERLNPISADAFVFRESVTSVWQKLFATLSLSHLWSVAVLYFASRESMRLSAAVSLAVAVFPFAAFFCGWALFVFVIAGR